MSWVLSSRIRQTKLHHLLSLPPCLEATVPTTCFSLLWPILVNLGLQVAWIHWSNMNNVENVDWKSHENLILTEQLVGSARDLSSFWFMAWTRTWITQPLAKSTCCPKNKNLNMLRITESWSLKMYQIQWWAVYLVLSCYKLTKLECQMPVFHHQKLCAVLYCRIIMQSSV